ncbi:MAG: hypothetical protein GY795_17865 [Desulfobacterales bacterium]|nr:hypothetical protein [Desulfobacterales bacterium]
MSILSQEVRNIQNSALGALLLWRFTYGYERGSGISSPTPFPLIFIVLPVVMHEETFQLVNSTQEVSGLRKFSGKFSESKHKKRDVLLSLHDRCKNMRKLSMESLSLAISSKLISIDKETAHVISLSSSNPKAGIPNTVRPMVRCAERLGVWCSNVSLHEVSVILKVVF